MISTVYIAKNVYGGDGLGRLGDGRVVFVPGAWAGEQVRAEIVEEKKHFVKARLIEVVEASPDRLQEKEKAVPGMVYAGFAYEAELKAKEQQLAEFFERARIDAGTIGRGENKNSLNYRNKVVYHFTKQGGEWAIGYRKEPSHEIVDVTSDPLARAEINAELPTIRKAVLALLTAGPIGIRKETERKGKVTIRWTRKTGVKWWIGDAPRDMVLKETTLGCDFEVPAGGFYQVNPEVGEELVSEVVKELSSAAMPAFSRVLDLYCGVGVFGICLMKAMAGKGCQLTGIESGREAIEFAKRNSASILSKGMPEARISFYAEEVGRNLRKISIGGETAVIIDPPRGGLEPGVAKWLAASRAPVIVYVSCDPATLMRDLRGMVDAYEVKKVKWFNMFPRTARFETMVILERKR